MTLCAAWIRKAGDNDELVFATDSCLSNGERWRGIKLFDLPRKDVLICFAGRTDRAYPLILNLITALRYNKDFQDKAKDISDLALFVSDLFTELVLQITDPVEPMDEVRAEADFLFGGWSWKLQQFVLFKIYYDDREQKFVFDDCLASKKARQIVFIGDEDVIPEAEKLYYKEFEGKQSENVLDMQPLRVLTIISRAPEFTTVAGALQIAKVYKSGHNEIFGVLWESIKGKPHFLGKAYQQFQKPEVRYFDPDTLVIHEIELPETLTQISEALFGEYTSFVEKCYPNGKRLSKLSKADRNLLLEVLKHSFYKRAVGDQQNLTINGDEEQQEEIVSENQQAVEAVDEHPPLDEMTDVAQEVPVPRIDVEAEPQEVMAEFQEATAEERDEYPIDEKVELGANEQADNAQSPPVSNSQPENGDNRHK